MQPVGGILLGLYDWGLIPMESNQCFITFG